MLYIVSKRGYYGNQRFDTLGSFRAVRRRDPFNEPGDMQYEMDRLFDRFGRDIAGTETVGLWVP